MRLLLNSALTLALTTSAAAQTWTVVPSPNPPGAVQTILSDVTVVAEDDVWAVGHWRDNAFQQYTLAMHWDGSAWTIVPTPSPGSPSGNTFTQLNAVVARAADDVWAAGLQNVPGLGGTIGPQILVLHWDGSTWSEVPAPFTPAGTNGAFVSDIVELTPSDLLFVGVGFSSPLGGTRHPLAMHWDGSDFSLDETPIVAVGSTSHEYAAVDAVSPTEVFTAGRVGLGSACGIPRILDRYDGQSWTTTDSPEPGWQHCFGAIEAIAADDVWATGSVNGPGGFDVLVMHWDGTNWSTVPAPGGGSSLLSFAPNDVLMGGIGIFQWDGTSWSPTESFPGFLNPAVRAMDPVGTDGGWGVWGVGSQGGFGSQTSFTTLRPPTSIAATETVRLGTPPNPNAFLPGITTPPILGTTWDPVIDHTTFAPLAALDLVGITLSPANLPLPPLGTLLCDLSQPPYLFTTTPGTPFSIPIPNSPNLPGVSLCAQGASTDASTAQLANALDIVLGDS